MVSINAAVNPKFKQLSQKQICNEKTVYAENYGCAANIFDFEILIKQLSNAGYCLTNNVNLANIILINTCGVKKPTEDRIIGRLQKLSEAKKPLIITGCLPRINPKAILKAAPDFSVSLDPHNVDKILEAARLAENGEKRRIFTSKKPILKLTLERATLKPPIEIILVSEGCAGSCSYCCVRFARGALFSYPKETVVQSLSQAIRNGIKEIWLTSQDTGAYGLDIHTNLAELLRECCKVEGKFFIRVGMMNPNHVLPIIDELIDVYRDEKIFKFLHLPVQSGDNLILKQMNRGYSVEDYLTIVHKFREKIPEITLSTDIICGFPGETEDNFQRTLNLVRQVKPDIVNISRFFPRPNTSAEKMKRIEVSTVKERSTLLFHLIKKLTYERNQKWVGWEGETLIDERGKGQSWIGRNFSYKPIVVKDDRNLLGKFVKVKVTKSFSTYLEAEVVNI
ncbi:tRNA (N(6)-L-threonylcarbamoyladenosine(37)-C(2))-methylthiotransferase [Candidatus Bathyarchaeota archaeon]|nr:tRNA (N(6)-L-threonylcarbamoyladenosine(37)-C(2))-methylthiotransferase [Candidatus Bathyarchaeota archaeon]